MSIKPLIPPVEALVQEELARASEQFGGRHHSPHEAYAVMLEELQEAQEESGDAHQMIDLYFYHVKGNSEPKYMQSTLRDLLNHSINAACEFIQLAAMCEKALRGYETEDNQ